MTYSFYLPKIETRSKDKQGLPVYSVKGYATTKNNTYTYREHNGRSFREYFSDEAMENLKRKAKMVKVFADVEHLVPTKNSTEMILNQISEKSGQNFNEEINYIKDRFKFSDIPMFKVEDINIDDKGLFVEIKGNPFYRNIDEEHKEYFDAVWGSLENGFINGMSLNFKATKTIQVNNELTQIDDIDFYGISLTGSPANEMATITEVAMRSIEICRGEQKCQKTNQIMTSSLMV